MVFHWTHMETAATLADEAIGVDYMAEQVITRWGTVTFDYVAVRDLARLSERFIRPRCDTCDWMLPDCACTDYLMMTEVAR